MEAAEIDVPIIDEEEEQRQAEEEEEAALEAEECHRRNLIAQGCLRFSVLMTAAAAGIELLERHTGFAVLYSLPLHMFPLACIAAALFGVMMALFFTRRTNFAMIVMIIAGWMALFSYLGSNLQMAETVVRPLPGTEKSVQMTLVTSYLSSTLCIEEPITENLLARRWTIPVHGSNYALEDLVELELQENDSVYLYFNRKLWAVYDPDTADWSDIVHTDVEEKYAVATEPEPDENDASWSRGRYMPKYPAPDR